MSQGNHTEPVHADTDSLALAFPKRMVAHGRHQEAVPPLNARVFLHSSGMGKTIVAYERGETIFTQGEPCVDILYIQRGGVKLTVLSKTGKEAVVAMIGAGDFFGEGCLTGQPIRRGSAAPSCRVRFSRSAKR